MSNEDMQPCSIEGDLLSAERTQWEYHVEQIGSMRGALFWLNQAGSCGWDLIQVVQQSDGLFAVFKRDRNLWSQES